MATWLSTWTNDVTFEWWLLDRVNQWPQYVDVAMFFGSLLTGALYFWVVWGATWIDMFVNLGLQYAIQQKGPHPTLHHHGYEMPAASSQLLLCISTMIILFHLLYRPRFDSRWFGVVFFFGVLALYARLYFRYNSLSQLFVGGLIGTCEGVLLTALWFYVGYPFTERMLSWSLARWAMLTDHFTCRRELETPDLSDELRFKALMAPMQLGSVEEVKAEVLRLGRVVMQERLHAQ